MDSMGAVFSILSLAFKNSSIDIIALVGYGAFPFFTLLPSFPIFLFSSLALTDLFFPPSVIVIAMEVLVGVLAVVLNSRARSHRAQLESTIPPSCTDSICGGSSSDLDQREKEQAFIQEEKERRAKEQEAQQVLPQVLPPVQEREMAAKVASSLA
jgi:hypothetical protein